MIGRMGLLLKNTSQSDLLPYFLACRQAQQFVNVEFLCKEGVITSGHMAFLTSISEVFKTILEPQQNESKVTVMLPDFEGKEVNQFLDYLYSGGVDTEGSIRSDEFFTLARHFGVPFSKSGEPRFPKRTVLEVKKERNERRCAKIEGIENPNKNVKENSPKSPSEKVQEIDLTSDTEDQDEDKPSPLDGGTSPLDGGKKRHCSDLPPENEVVPQQKKMKFEQLADSNEGQEETVQADPLRQSDDGTDNGTGRENDTPETDEPKEEENKEEENEEENEQSDHEQETESETDDTDYVPSPTKVQKAPKSKSTRSVRHGPSCALCKKEHSNLAKLLDHMSVTHYSDRFWEMFDTKKGRCPYCPKKWDSSNYAAKERFAKHVGSSHKMVLDYFPMEMKTPLKPYMAGKEKVPNCQLCGKKSKTFYDLLNHLTRNHYPKRFRDLYDAKQGQCPHCSRKWDRTASNAHAFVSHVGAKHKMVLEFVPDGMKAEMKPFL